MIRYVSTRGSQQDSKTFSDVLMTGMAPDGGLYVPDVWPSLDRNLMDHMAGTPYTEIAAAIMTPFIGDALPAGALDRILHKAYNSGAFNHSAIAPLTQIGPNAWLLELFHGPTLSFKDYALQFIGHLYDDILQSEDRRITIIGATSGDTGSAALEACRHSSRITSFILHPKDRTSAVQRRQMTTIDAPNVFNIAIDGTFDDCQAIVKTMLSDAALQAELNLGAVNSINWARIMAQIVYYTYAAVSLGAPHRPVSFTVPTGNFGNVYAGWAARRMGVPIHRLNVASNRNDILTRFFESGDMRIEKVSPSLSPSMDIQVSSNFERYLFDLLRRDTRALNGLMADFKKNKSFNLPPHMMTQAQREFGASRTDDDETLDTMRECYEQTGILIDPHTAVGLHGAMQVLEDPSIPSVILACAHPAKFPDAVEKATGIRPPLPPHLATLMDKPEHFTVMPNDAQKMIAMVRSELKNRN